MRKVAMVLLAVVALTLIGCGTIDWLMGVDEKGERVGPPGTSPIELVGQGGRALGVPYAGEIGVGLGLLWAMIRGRRWKKLARAGIRGVAKIRASGEEKVKVSDLTNILEREQGAEGVWPYARAVVKKVEKTV